MKFTRYALIAAFSLMLGGCIIVPVKGEIKDSEMKRVQPGVSTLDDVTAIAGKPPAIWEWDDKHVAVFSDGATNLTIPLFMVFLASPSDPVMTDMDGHGDYEAFLVQYDDAGIVRRIEKKDFPKHNKKGDRWPEFVKEWAEAPSNGEKE